MVCVSLSNKPDNIEDSEVPAIRQLNSHLEAEN